MVKNLLFSVDDMCNTLWAEHFPSTWFKGKVLPEQKASCFLHWVKGEALPAKPLSFPMGEGAIHPPAALPGRGLTFPP